MGGGETGMFTSLLINAMHNFMTLVIGVAPILTNILINCINSLN